MIKPPFFQASNARPWIHKIEYRSPQSDGLVLWWCPSIWTSRNSAVNGPWVRDEFFRWGIGGGGAANTGQGTNQENADLIGATDLGGLCVNFDGSNEHQNYATAQRQQGEMSVCAWIRPTSVAVGEGTIVAETSSSTAFDYGFVINKTAGKYTFYQGNDGGPTNATTSLTVNVWQHVAAVRTGSSGSWTITYYYNGIADGTDAVTVDPNSGAGHVLSVGRWGLLNARYIPADMADVRVYNRALSASEIEHQYSPPTRWDLYRPQDSGTPALWKLGQGAHIFYPAIVYPQIYQKLMVV